MYTSYSQTYQTYTKKKIITIGFRFGRILFQSLLHFKYLFILVLDGENVIHANPYYDLILCISKDNNNLTLINICYSLNIITFF